ncbi:MAG: ferritin-like domain-containing protein [Woeseia sp.]
MEKAAEMGKNRTGIDMSPAQSEEMLRGGQEFTGSQDYSRTAEAADIETPDMVAIDTQYIQESDPVGSVPMPGTLRGVLKTGKKKAGGHNAEVFLNKLGERLAYERSGVRLYESVITKCEAADDLHPAGPVTVEELRHIRDEEAEHFLMLKEAMVALGADPTAQTPDADVSGVAAMGMQQVLNDPRTTMSQCLEVLLSIELTDNAAWELLIMLAEGLKADDLVEQFQQALTQEEEHVQRIRSWYEEMMMPEGGGRKKVKH